MISLFDTKISYYSNVEDNVGTEISLCNFLFCGMFGEHLLSTFPSQTVALVMDEMTAAVMSCFPTPYVWHATGKELATPSDLLPLVGKSVVVFLNKVEYSKLQKTLQAVPNLQFHISDVMEKARRLPHHCPDGSSLPPAPD